MSKLWVISSLVVSFSCSFTSALDFEGWITKHREQSFDLLLRNVSPPETTLGVVVASPSKMNPDYWYHWIRDSALVMDVVVEMYARSTGSEKEKFDRLLLNYVNFSRRNQMTPTVSGNLGEPKFHVDGTPFIGPWGRPQNDGPALRAITLTRLAIHWLREGKERLVREKLYDVELPAHRVIKADLEFISHHWRDKNYDLWEEISGDHFYTRMVQRRALIDGATLAAILGDPKASGWYLQQARHLENEIQKHWDPKRGILVATLNRNEGVDYKWSGLDSAIVLGVLHGYTADGFYGTADPQVLATVYKLEGAFRKLYPINQQDSSPGLALGRYPEDRYDGLEVATQGNPWFLITAGYSELYHSLANQLRCRGNIEITAVNFEFFADLGIEGLMPGTIVVVGDPLFERILRQIRAKADLFLRRVQFHGADGHFAEQINRWTGFMQGAKDLTWSYAALLTAVWERAGHWHRPVRSALH